MKIPSCLAAGLLALSLMPVFSQPSPVTGRPATMTILNTAPSQEPALTKFSLDFPGGTPKELVAAIQKAMVKPLNAIIPEEYADTVMPSLKMNNVDVSQLFEALRGSGSSFMSSGSRTDDSVWFFRGNRLLRKACRFYSLAPYLERGLKLDDITTAIQTGWKMMGDKETPTISFHKDTKLLIAVGEPSKLETIDAVLKALQLPPAPVIPGVAPKPEPPAKPAEKPTDNQ